MRNALYILRRYTPKSMLQSLHACRMWVWRARHGLPEPQGPFEASFPLCSPDVWARFVKAYAGTPEPAVFEYGLGVSTIHHLARILEIRGTYSGVEHDIDWYNRVVREVLAYCGKNQIEVTVTREDTRVLPGAVDTVFLLRGPNGSCRVKLMYRPPSGLLPDGDGSLAEYEAYVHALDDQCDAVAIDGRARKACVNHVLSSGLLRRGGVLMLHDAGRGVDGWLAHPATTGASDYQPEVRALVSLGGQVVDGAGMDAWPGLRKRRDPNMTAFGYPLEACFWVRPAEPSSALRIQGAHSAQNPAS